MLYFGIIDGDQVLWNLTNEEVKNLDKKKWIIIDGNSLIYRTFYALPH